MPIASIEALIQLGLTVFTQVWTLFKVHNVPTSSAGTITSALNSTPGSTPAHQAVVAASVQAAASVANSVPVTPQQ